MIETKYLIIIGVVICVLVLYYFYDEISSTKKLMIPTYQKTMYLEAKIIELEKKTQDLSQNQQLQLKQLKNTRSNSSTGPSQRKKPIDSPALSITYQSDMVNKNSGNNLSVIYADLTETEVNEIRQKIESANKSSNRSSSNKSVNKPVDAPINKPQVVGKLDTEPDIFDFNETEQSIALIQSQAQSQPHPQPQLHSPYQKILDNLSTDINIITQRVSPPGTKSDSFSSMFDSEVAKCISDSVNCMDLDQTNMSDLSEIPADSDVPIKPTTTKVNKTLTHKKKRSSK